MKGLGDELLFDDRNAEGLIASEKSAMPLYADVVERWAGDDKLTIQEERVAASVLIFYPRYIYKSMRYGEAALLFEKALLAPDVERDKDLQKGLYLYCLFFCRLKAGENGEILSIYDRLVKTIHDYNTGIPESLKADYQDIAAMVLGSDEYRNFIKIYGVRDLPMAAPLVTESEGSDLRYKAYDLFLKKKYDEAMEIYRKLTLFGYEPAGIFTHMARVELAKNNVPEASRQVVKAWGLRGSANTYEVPRILFFIIFLNMLKKDSYAIWIGCLKQALSRNGSTNSWELCHIIGQYSDRLGEENSAFLGDLLSVLSGWKSPEYLNKYEIWDEADALPGDKWPEFSDGK
ncbi:MAG: hypothetical protein HQL30_09230 [Candidatus Omnitrophica bacterium]|nr:hypothetical protein [Candidatus Omnitrophota bacterium]